MLHLFTCVANATEQEEMCSFHRFGVENTRRNDENTISTH